MRVIQHSRTLRLLGILLGAMVWLANNSNPPTARTGAPFDFGDCNDCHSGGNYNANVDISGLPGTIQPNTTYPLTYTVSATAGNPIRAGFQLVVVDGNNANCGNLASVNTETGTEFFSSREYVEQRGGKAFSGGTVSWTFNWTSPASVPGNTVKLYYIANLCNGNGGTGDDNAVSFNESYTFAGAPPVSASITNQTNVLCFGGNTGNATVTATGGNPPYTYLWSNGQSGQTANNLVAGTYTVTVTATGGGGTATASAVITQPAALTASTNNPSQLTCVNTSSTISVNVGGGTAPYSYFWSNNETGSSIQVSQAGNYNVTVTDDNGCTKVANATVTTSTTPPIAVAGPPGQISCTNSTVVLNGTGSSFGSAFSYLWTASNGGNIQSGSTTLMPVVNAVGTYTLKVTNNNNGCTSTSSTQVTLNGSVPQLSTTGGNITCSNTTAQVCVTASPAGGQYAYSWAGPGIVSGSSASCATVNQAGNYTVTVTNLANGCTATATAPVTQNTTVPLLSITGVTLTCSSPSAQICVTASPANGQYTYSWSGPGIVSGGSTSCATVNQAATYIVTVTNTANGCTSTISTQVTQNTAPPQLTTTNGTLTCAQTNTQICVTATPAGNQYTYNWTGPTGQAGTTACISASNAGPYTVIVTNTTNGCTSSASSLVTADQNLPTASVAAPAPLTCVNTSVQLNGNASSQGTQYSYLWTTTGGNIQSGATTLTPVVTAPGPYTLKVTNNTNGCTSTVSVQVVQNIAAPQLSTTEGTLTCINTIVQCCVTASPAGGQYAYSWSGPSITSGANSNCASVSQPGTYAVVVTNTENGCTSASSASVDQDLSTPLVEASVPGNLNCNNSTIQINGSASSQGPNFTYLWSTVNGNILNGANTISPTVNAAGDYGLTVTNTNNGCTATTTASVQQSMPLTLTPTVQNVSCFSGANGAASVTVAGGVPSYTYLWSNGATTSGIAGVPAGAYAVTATDTESCTLSASLTINQPVQLTVNVTATPETALGANNGTVNALPNGGTPNYTFAWSNGATTASQTGLAPGNYIVTATDANGCTAVQSITVNAFNCNLSIDLTTVSLTCFGGLNGQICVTATGAVNPLTYLWSNTATTACVTNIPAGSYSVTVVDGAGCSSVRTVAINQPPNLLSNVTATNQTAVGVNNGTATAQPTGGVPGYTYSWSNGQTTQTITGLAPGTYTVTVTDANTCTATQSITVNAYICNLSASLATTNVPCNGGATGAVTAMVVNGQLPISYAWSNSATTPSLTGIPAGTYILTATDGAGCTVSASATVVQPTAITVIPNIKPASCTESSDGSIELNATGGTLPYTYSLPNSNGQNLPSGNYTITITDANGCLKLISVTVGIADIVPPTLTCPPNQSVCVGTTVTYPLPVISDNCSVAGIQPQLTSGLASGSVFTSTSLQTFTASDVAGNKSTCSFEVIVNQPPVVVIDSVKNAVNGGNNGSIFISVIGQNGPVTYSWEKDGIAVSTQEDPSDLSPGSYTIKVSDAGGCTVLVKDVIVGNTVGVNDPKSLSTIFVRPNPVQTTLFIDSGEQQVLAARIYDSRGSLIREIEVSTLSNGIDVKQLPDGMYYLQLLVNKGGRQNIRWIKTSN